MEEPLVTPELVRAWTVEHYENKFPELEVHDIPSPSLYGTINDWFADAVRPLTSRQHDFIHFSMHTAPQTSVDERKQRHFTVLDRMYNLTVQSQGLAAPNPKHIHVVCCYMREGSVSIDVMYSLHK